MIFWIIMTVITFFFLRWIITVPCLVSKRTLVSEKQESQYFNEYTYTYVPIGMKVWIFILLVLVSLTPVINIIGILIGIIWPLTQSSVEDIPWDAVFPKGSGKVVSFLNKPL